MEIQSTQVCISLKSLFSRHKGIGVQFTDEPTGSLDRKNKEIVMRLLKKLQKENKTILMVSHDDESLEYCSRVVCL